MKHTKHMNSMFSFCSAPNSKQSIFHFLMLGLCSYQMLPFYYPVKFPLAFLRLHRILMGKTSSMTQISSQTFWWAWVVNDCIPTIIQFFFRLVYRAQEMKISPRKFSLHCINVIFLIANNILHSIYFI